MIEESVNVKVIYRDPQRESENYKGVIKILTCGVLTIEEKLVPENTGLVAHVETTRTVGIPLDLILKYEVN